MDNRCPECKTPLLAGSIRCECGWIAQKTPAQGGLKCLCGRLARINYNGFKCWPCYGHAIEGTDREDWRDKLIREKQAEYNLPPNHGEPDYVVAKRARDLYKEFKKELKHKYETNPTHKNR